MKFRPCIDIHNGKVKQIVGGSLKDEGDRARENFVSGQDAAFYARLYRRHGLEGGHIILLNASESPYYEATRKQAIEALKAYPGGLQIGGGVTRENAADYLNAGAAKVIVTSYVFREGEVDFDRLKALSDEVGPEKLVLDLSCRKQGDDYYIVTDRWQKFTRVMLNRESLELFSDYADEFLIHAVDVEGQAKGIEEGVAALLGKWGRLPMTYAGGIRTREDLRLLDRLGKGRIDFTIGSALDLFGGTLPFEEVICFEKKL
ncbi:MAG: phosphoribosylformimino-5-aminoimidazole carboxamide ribotide isomerase [Lachnospiraceae bacterium]|nr:phosphoribosylformimino-5-aminoimidazole carboxamide ribotide isomerase [Lachnospiraceae bacterium]